MAPWRKRINNGSTAPTKPWSFASAVAVESSDNILTQILKHMPAKPLFCFKLFSKRWFSLISDPFFTSIWKPKLSGLIIQNCSNKTCQTKYQYVHLEAELPKRLQDNFSSLNPDGNSIKDIEILSSCNGLFLIRCTKGSKLSYNYTYFVCNPTTKEYASLPCPERRSAWKELKMFMAYDLSKSMAYKVIAFSSRYRTQICVNLYSSESKSWRGLEGTALGDACFNWGVFFDGFIIFPALRSEESQCFSVSKEVFQRFPMPPFQNSNQQRKLEYVGETNLGDHLCLIQASCSETNKFCIYQMKRGDFNWYVKYHVDVTGLATVIHVLYMSSNEEEVSSMIVHVQGRAMSYKLKDNTYKDLQKMSLPILDQKCLVVHQLIENPFCLLNKKENKYSFF